MELSLLMFFLVVFCGQPIWMVNNCPLKANCPKYKVIEETEKYEKREYNSTEWIAVEVEGEQPSHFYTAHSILKEAVGDDLRDCNPWPVLIMKTNDNKVFLCWFLPTNVTVRDNNPSVLRIKRPKTISCVRQFGGIPNISNGRANAQKLCEDLKKPAEVCLNCPFSGAGYDKLFDLIHHNEVWMDC